MSFNKEEFELPIQESLLTWSADSVFNYQLVHKCAKVLYLCYGTQGNRGRVQNKVGPFSNSLGEGFWRFVPNEALVPITPHPPDYDKLATAFSESLNLFSSMVPAALLHKVRDKVQQDIKSSIDILESKKEILQSNICSLGGISSSHLTGVSKFGLGFSRHRIRY